MLSALGNGLAGALAKFQSASDVNEETIKSLITDICTALVAADVHIKIVSDLRTSVRERCRELHESQKVAAAQLKRRVQQAVYEELIAILSPPTPRYQLVRGRPNVIMFVGLQGAGKTTTCTKFANYYKKRGWRVALVCADTYRAGAFDQLKQNAAKCKIPFYGSYSAVDAAEIAAKGVATFKKERAEVIIVDTSGRHKQEEALFDEMIAIDQAVHPNEVVFVMDSHIGQACALQAEAFKKSVRVASVIVTKLDGHAKGGGAITAVATTGCPISFIGTGEGFDALEVFDPPGFVSKLMGMGDTRTLVRTLQEFMPEHKSAETLQRITAGHFTYNDMKGQLKTMTTMGGIANMLSCVPGMSALSGAMPAEMQDHTKKMFDRFLNIIDSMSRDERECRVEIDDKAIIRLARGAGAKTLEVQALIEQRRLMARTMGKVGRGMAAAKRGGGLPPNLMQMASALGGR